MKKLFSVMVALTMMASLLVSTVSAAPAALLTPTLELGQLKVCKVAGSGVAVGTVFTFRVNGNSYNVPAGPSDRNGYCVLAGQYPVNTPVTIEEVIPSGYLVSRIEVKPDRTISRDTAKGIVTVQIVSGVIEAIFTNKASDSLTATPTSVTSTPRPTKTATSTPSCAPNCTPTSTPIPMGRMQICKEADGPGVTGSFTFRFETRSRSVPVGACAGLIAVDAGTLTVTEDAQTGYSVADIYTIPADRLISKDLSAGKATVRIVEGTAISQTIVIFRNRAATTGSLTPTFTPTSPSSATPTATGSITATSTFTPTATGSITATSTFTPTATPTFTATSTGSVTPTFTPTPTSTGPVLCPPTVIYANFNNVPVGQSVEGMGTVAPYLDINAKRLAVRVAQVSDPFAYQAPNGSGGVVNGGLVADGGFSDVQTKDLFEAHQYTFNFAPGVSVTNFSLHMLDYGDWNFPHSASHFASMTAYDANGQEIPNAKEVLSYTTPTDETPRSSNLYGDLYFNGDAVTAPPGQPGNWTWSVSGSGIAKVVLDFGAGYDPNIAFDLLSYTTECSSCQSFTAANFNNVPVGQSVEGMGAVAPNLNIDARGTAMRVVQASDPMIYLAPNGSGNVNGGLVADGGFSDVPTKNLFQAHQYTFTFAPGVSITNFSLHMLDYGDWNFPRTTSHFASMTAYNANGQEIPNAKEVLSFTTPPDETPRSSNLYGDLYFNGDAASAPPGQPGNWTWNISGNGITKVVLDFGIGYDPNIAFDLLYFNVVCQ